MGLLSHFWTYTIVPVSYWEDRISALELVFHLRIDIDYSKEQLGKEKL